MFGNCGHLQHWSDADDKTYSMLQQLCIISKHPHYRIREWMNLVCVVPAFPLGP